jgi:hypothetical protein
MPTRLESATKTNGLDFMAYPSSTRGTLIHEKVNGAGEHRLRRNIRAADSTGLYTPTIWDSSAIPKRSERFADDFTTTLQRSFSGL